MPSLVRRVTLLWGQIAKLREKPTLIPVLRPLRKGKVTVVVPAHNEGPSIGETVKALLRLKILGIIHQIIVVDDCSTDNTGDIARALGVRVIRTPINKRHKSWPLNIGLDKVGTEFVLIVDADTIVGVGVVEAMLKCLRDDPLASHVSCAVFPQSVETLWRMARSVELIYSLRVIKKVLDQVRNITVSSGCCVLFRTKLLIGLGKFSLETRAEDALVTIDHKIAGYHARFLDRVFCFTQDPPDGKTYRLQKTRWTQEPMVNWRSRFWKLFWRCPGFLVELTYQQHRQLLGLLGLSELIWYTNTALDYAALALITLKFVQIYIVAMVCHTQLRKYDACGVDPGDTSFWRILVGTSFLLTVVNAIDTWIYYRSLWRVFVTRTALPEWNKGH